MQVQDVAPARSLFLPSGDNIGLERRVRLPTLKSRMSTGDPGMPPGIQGHFLARFSEERVEIMAKRMFAKRI